MTNSCFAKRVNSSPNKTYQLILGSNISMYYRKCSSLYPTCLKSFYSNILNHQQVKEIKISYIDVTWPQWFKKSFDLVVFVKLQLYSLLVLTQIPKEIFRFFFGIYFLIYEKSI